MLVRRLQGLAHLDKLRAVVQCLLDSTVHILQVGTRGATEGLVLLQVPHDHAQRAHLVATEQLYIDAMRRGILRIRHGGAAAPRFSRGVKKRNCEPVGCLTTRFTKLKLECTFRL